VENLDRIKTAIDEGLNLSSRLSLISSGYPASEEALESVRQYRIALNGARITAVAFGSQSLVTTIQELSEAMSVNAQAASKKETEEEIDILPILTKIEREYMELKLTL